MLWNEYMVNVNAEMHKEPQSWRRARSSKIKTEVCDNKRQNKHRKLVKSVEKLWEADKQMVGCGQHSS